MIAVIQDRVRFGVIDAVVRILLIGRVLHIGSPNGIRGGTLSRIDKLYGIIGVVFGAADRIIADSGIALQRHARRERDDIAHDVVDQIGKPVGDRPLIDAVDTDILVIVDVVEVRNRDRYGTGRHDKFICDDSDAVVGQLLRVENGRNGIACTSASWLIIFCQIAGDLQKLLFFIACGFRPAGDLRRIPARIDRIAVIEHVIRIRDRDGKFLLGDRELCTAVLRQAVVCRLLARSEPDRDRPFARVLRAKVRVARKGAAAPRIGVGIDERIAVKEPCGICSVILGRRHGDLHGQRIVDLGVAAEAARNRKADFTLFDVQRGLRKRKGIVGQIGAEACYRDGIFPDISRRAAGNVIRSVPSGRKGRIDFERFFIFGSGKIPDRKRILRRGFAVNGRVAVLREFHRELSLPDGEFLGVAVAVCQLVVCGVLPFTERDNDFPAACILGKRLTLNALRGAVLCIGKHIDEGVFVKFSGRRRRDGHCDAVIDLSVRFVRVDRDFINGNLFWIDCQRALVAVFKRIVVGFKSFRKHLIRSDGAAGSIVVLRSAVCERQSVLFDNAFAVRSDPAALVDQLIFGRVVAIRNGRALHRNGERFLVDMERGGKRFKRIVPVRDRDGHGVVAGVGRDLVSGCAVIVRHAQYGERIRFTHAAGALQSNAVVHESFADGAVCERIAAPVLIAASDQFQCQGSRIDRKFDLERGSFVVRLIGRFDSEMRGIRARILRHFRACAVNIIKRPAAAVVQVSG